MNSFKGLKYRQQVIFNNKKLLIVNDSKSTSFASTINLLKSYKNIHWIVGGKYKKGDKFFINKKYYKNINAYIYGLKTDFFRNQFKNKIRFKVFSTIKNALLKIIQDTKNNNFSKIIILFSPSAASFDQFKNFEERGNKFKAIVNEQLNQGFKK